MLVFDVLLTDHMGSCELVVGKIVCDCGVRRMYAFDAIVVINIEAHKFTHINTIINTKA